MAKIRNRPTPWADKYDEDNYKDYRRGGMDDAFWDEDELVDHRKVSKKKRPRKKRGCPENNFGAHVYIWVTETRYHYSFTAYGYVMDKNKPYTVENKTCCGCGKVSNRKYNW